MMPTTLIAADNRTVSIIRTMTVGSGIAPDLLTLHTQVKALAGSQTNLHTAGGDFHPALRTRWFYSRSGDQAMMCVQCLGADQTAVHVTAISKWSTSSRVPSFV